MEGQSYNNFLLSNVSSDEFERNVSQGRKCMKKKEKDVFFNSCATFSFFNCLVNKTIIFKCQKWETTE